jgi:signal transduction histidine kinase
MTKAVSNGNPSSEKIPGEVDFARGFHTRSNRKNWKRRTRELVRMSRYRSLFLARLAHELRTPLTSILGFSEFC